MSCFFVFFSKVGEICLANLVECAYHGGSHVTTFIFRVLGVMTQVLTRKNEDLNYLPDFPLVFHGIERYS